MVFATRLAEGIYPVYRCTSLKSSEAADRQQALQAYLDRFHFD
jgi:hypothetical protein